MENRAGQLSCRVGLEIIVALTGRLATSVSQGCHALACVGMFGCSPIKDVIHSMFFICFDIEIRDIENYIGIIPHQLHDGLEEILRPHGLMVPDYYVLGVLRRCGPPFRQPIGLLCKHSLLSNAAMTNRADRLEKKGLVERMANPKDRRGVLLALTKAGRKLDDQGKPVRGASVEVWQADINGRYKHPRIQNQHELDPFFMYFASVKTKEDGLYLFKTIVPRWYSFLGIFRAPHIHIKVKEANYCDRLVGNIKFKNSLTTP